MILLIPLAPASAAPYATTVVYQASGTASPPANGNSPFASCDISGFLIPGETNYVNTELEPWVAVNPTNPDNIIASTSRTGTPSAGPADWRRRSPTTAG
jgi:hypothetical protein